MIERAVVAAAGGRTHLHGGARGLTDRAAAAAAAGVLHAAVLVVVLETVTVRAELVATEAAIFAGRRHGH